MAAKHARRARRRMDGAVRRANLRSHWRADGTAKTSYRSQAEALSVADERKQDVGVELSAYPCEFCSGWHLGGSDRDA